MKKTKRLAVIFMAAVMVLSLCACGGGSGDALVIAKQHGMAYAPLLPPHVT